MSGRVAIIQGVAARDRVWNGDASTLGYDRMKNQFGGDTGLDFAGGKLSASETVVPESRHGVASETGRRGNVFSGGRHDQIPMRRIRSPKFSPAVLCSTFSHRAGL